MADRNSMTSEDGSKQERKGEKTVVLPTFYTIKCVCERERELRKAVVQCEHISFNTLKLYNNNIN